MQVITPSKKKILLYSTVFLALAAICYFIEIFTNKITQGTGLIKNYESVFFYLLACYYLIQLIPGFARFIIDKDGFKEIWFFRQRINISWLSVNSQLNKFNRAGDTLYINTEAEHFFSRKLVCKGAYALSDKELYQKISEQLDSLPVKSNSRANHYLVLGQMRATLLISLTILLLAFNSYYLLINNTDSEFIDQLNDWQQQSYSDEQLFELFKPYGFYWKTQLKQYDRKLYQRILLQESKQIEAALLKRNTSLSDSAKEQLKIKFSLCKKQFLFSDENKYFECMANI